MTMRSPTLSPGDRIADRYEVLRVVGSGGMGHVFAARRIALDDLVAIKCVHENRLDPENRARFLREARAMARIRHPNVVQVFDFGDPEHGAPYLVMELLEGPTLGQLLATQGALSVERTLALFAQLCAAVEAGHRRGVVHRDLKPGNIVLSRDDDGGETLKVLDFGLARLVGDASRGDDLQTQAGVLMGTSAYMSPEQIETGEAGPASDVFALGVILYELVTGELPFRGPNAVATIMRITSGEYTPPEQHVPSLPSKVCEAIAAALGRDPAQRPASARELARHLDLERATSTWTASSGDLATQAHGQQARGAASSDAAGSTAARPSLSGGHDADGNVTRAQETTLDALRSSAPRLHGRRGELEALGDALQATRASLRPRVSLVTGEPGMGKSALVERYRDSLGAGLAQVYRARFYAYEGDRPPPNETFLWMLSDSAQSHDEGLGGSPAQEEQSPESHTADKWRAFERIAGRFLRRAGERPLVLIFDDLQWATRLELDCIGYLLRAFDDHAVHIVLTARSEAVRPDAQSEVSRWLTQLARQNPGSLGRVPLQPLGRAALRRWLEAAYAPLRAQPAQFRRLHRATGGNPHYFTELVRQLTARGALRREGEGEHEVWVLDAPFELDLPESVAQAVLANLADLGEDARKVAEIASVVGEELRFESLQLACGLSEDALETVLESREMAAVLTERGTSSGADYRFISPTVRGVLYDAMSRRRRRRAHRSVVDALETLYSGDPTRIAKVLCYHFEAVADWPRCLETGLTAARSTLAQFDADNAELAIRRVQAAIDGLRESGDPVPAQIEGQALSMRGTLLARLGRHQQAEDALELADAAARRDGDELGRVQILLTLADCQVGRGELNQGVQTCDDAMRLAQTLGEPARVLLWEAAVKGASTLARLGRYDEADILLLPLLEIKGDTDLARLQAHAHREQAWMLTRRGDLKTADVHAAESMHLARIHRDPYARYLATSVQAIIVATRGDAPAAIELYEQALRMARGLSLRRREMIELANSAMAYLQLGDADEALRRMLQTRALCVELGDRASEGDSWVGMGRVLVARGELDEAHAALGRGRALCEASGRTEYAALATLEMGLVELERADPESAVTLLEDAKTAFETNDSVYLWRVYQGLARALMTEPGRRADADAYAQLALTRLAELMGKGGDAGREHDSMRTAQASLRDLLQSPQA